MSSIFDKKFLFRSFSPTASAYTASALICAVFILSFFAISSVAHAYDRTELKISKSIANIREKADLKSPVVWVLSPAESFLVDKGQKGWFAVYPASSDLSGLPIGYISKKIVIPAAQNSPVVDWGDVRYVGKELNYHVERSSKSAVAGKLAEGDKIKVGFLRGGWYAIFKVDKPVASEEDALGFVEKGLVDIKLDDARIRYAVRKISVIQKPVATSKAVGVLNPGHRAQVGKEKGGMYALYRIDTFVKKDTPVWGYAWGPFLAAYPKNLEKKKMVGIDTRKAELEAEKQKKKVELQKRTTVLASMDKAMDEVLNAPIVTKTMFASAVLNVRSEPNAKSLIVDKLEVGQAVLVGPEEGKWFPVFKAGATVESDSRIVGYVYKAYLNNEPPVEVKKDRPAKKRIPGGPDEVPIKITSKKMTFSENKNQITFSGNVKVVRLDVTLTSDTLTAFLKAGGDSLKDTQDKIKEIVAKGRVKVNMNNRKGSCEKLTFVVVDSIILMEGNAKLQDGPNLVQGNLIKFYLKDNRSEVVGGDKPVEAIFFTPKNVAP
ncbi:LptA/OstA family protein [Maridesulfovibrio ferrireducens]|uniref:LptA/OstA family protein n=1 Tax=Maridesulfovibrio ferrireducens TaxID=246191 RepID=UPI001A24FF86|nr:LptA/OstA family protein [Maridesulfovibrio ferrireducens]MBI9111672.1 LPS ABC transporter substrate-binding protein LptA [Maridesulfovibrio ferrireducens]